MFLNNCLDVSYLNKYIIKVNNINILKFCMVKYNFYGIKMKVWRCLYRLFFI